MTKEQTSKLVKVKFAASRDIKVLKTDAEDVQITKFNSGWYVPYEKLLEIYVSEDPISAYKEWVLSKAEDEICDVYDDWSNCNEEPIGTEVVNIGKDNVARFEAWVEKVQSEGYEVYLDAIDDQDLD